MESFINKILEINQRKAIQGDVSLVYKEVMDLAKDYMENVSDFVTVVNRDVKFGNGSGSGVAGYKTGNKKAAGGVGNNRMGAGEGAMEHMRKLLKGQLYRDVEFCLEYNLKGDRGGPKCTDRRCKLAHNCAFVPRGESKACGGTH